MSSPDDMTVIDLHGRPHMMRDQHTSSEAIQAYAASYIERFKVTIFNLLHLSSLRNIEGFLLSEQYSSQFDHL
jgi:imidazoleglycerol phosphate dehydratase HisB